LATVIEQIQSGENAEAGLVIGGDGIVKLK
jgi:hypothetical protein